MVSCLNLVFVIHFPIQKEYLDREIEKTIIRTNPLGKDRDYNTYWFFRRDARIFVESSDSMRWGYYYSKDEVSMLLHALFFLFSICFS